MDEITQVRLTRLPMPPSVNKAYRTFHIHGIARRGKTKELQKFERHIVKWGLANTESLREVKELTDKCSKDLFLHVKVQFFFHHKAILCKDGSPKRNDTENRMKPVLDGVAGILGIDDKWFWSGSFEKFVCPEYQDEHCNVEITHFKLAR